MNKFIEYDIHNGITQIKCAIMNVLDALDKMEINSYNFGPYIPLILIEECMGVSGWEICGDIFYSPSKRDFKFTENFELKLYDNEIIDIIDVDSW